MTNLLASPAEKMKQLIEEIKDSNEFERKIHNKYITEFEERISNIIIQSESEFMLNFSKRMDLLLRDEYSDDSIENEILINLSKQITKKIYDKFYKPMKNLFIKAVNDYEITSKSIKNGSVFNLFFSQNFRKHCVNCDNFAFHSCKGNFIPVYTNYKMNLDTDNLLEKIPKEGLKFQQVKSIDFLTFVVCTQCKKAYLSKDILMFCFTCNVNFHSTVLKNEDLQLQPATWETYHCKALLNDTMKCINCKSVLFINMSTNMLECKKCNLSCDPYSILWKCIKCSDEFNSNAKIYNQLEFKAVNRAIKIALIEKKIIKPLEVNCCKLDIENTNFFHKKECVGPLYEGNLDDQVIVICGICHVMNYFLRFIWTCPICFKRFNLKKVLLKQISNELSENSLKLSLPKRSVVNDSNYGKKLSIINDKQIKNLATQLEKKNTAPNMKQQIGFIKSNNFTFPKNVNKNLEFTPYENVKGISMLRYTKIATKNMENEEALDDRIPQHMKLNTVFKSTLTTDSEQQDSDLINESKTLIKPQFKTIDENHNKLDYDKRIIKPRNLTPVFDRCEDIKKSKNESENRRKNMQLLNPFKCNKTSSVSHGANKVKKEYEETKRKHNNDASPLKTKDFENYNFDDEEKSYHLRNLKNLNINLNFHTIDDQENDDLREEEILKNNFCEEKVRDFDENNETEFNQDGTLPSFIVEDYRFVHLIGDGSFGSIYLCMDKNEQMFAIKKIILQDKQKIDQINREFELAHQLKHKNILRIYASSKRKLDSTTQVLYVLMELANSDWKYEILMRMREKKFYTEKELISIVSQIIDGLSYIQSKDIAHRDIKPENILSFKNGVYKVADFGCAKEMKDNNLNTLKGTEYFISPALYNALINNIASDGVEHNAIKSDVYSLGLCVLYAATLSVNHLTEIRNIADQNILFNFLKKSLSRYSQTFINFVYRMLDLNEELRFDFLDLQDCLKKK